MQLEDTTHLAIPGIVQGGFAGFTAPNGKEFACLVKSRTDEYGTDPVFFLHHAQLDRLWWLWQHQAPDRINQYGGASYRDAPASEGSADVGNTLSMGGLAPDIQVAEIMDIRRGPLCYTYF